MKPIKRKHRYVVRSNETGFGSMVGTMRGPQGQRWVNVVDRDGETLLALNAAAAREVAEALVRHADEIDGRTEVQ